MEIAYFTDKQLIEIYEEAGRNLDVDALQATAKRLYPDTLEPDGRSPVFVREGAGKMFLVDGEYQKAHHSITSRKVNAIGIMDDGTPIPY